MSADPPDAAPPQPIDHAGLIAAARRQLPAGPPEGAAAPPGELFGAGAQRYRLLRELHRGGQGVVYLAEQLSPQRRVAVKMVREGPLAAPGEHLRLRREIELLGSLQHPNIVAIHDSGGAPGAHYFVMDHVDGPTLDAYVRPRREAALADRQRQARQRFLQATLTLFVKVCDAVQAAHLRGIIHRDLKPSNIRIDQAGEPRVLDFGLAKQTLPGDRDRQLTEQGQFVGTLAYASPEQADGGVHSLDVRSDVYSLGVVLYELLTGQLPYPVSGSFSDVLAAIRDTPPACPSLAVPALPADLEVIVLTCLQKDRERRYQTAGALAADLRRFLAGDPIDARRDSGWYVLRRTIRKHRLPVAAAAIVFLAITVGFFVSFGFWRSAVHRAEQVRAEAHKARTISEFLHQMLASADPYRLPGEPARVRDVLDEAERRLARGALRDQPLTEAALRNTLGMSYLALGRKDEALRQLERALALRRDALPAGSVDLAESHLNLGEARFRDHDYERARGHLNAVLASAAAAPRQRAGAEFRLGTIAANLGMLDSAGEHLERSLALLGDGGDPELRAACLGGLADVVAFRGDPDRGIELAREAVRSTSAALGEHPHLIATLTNLSTSLARGAQRVEAYDVARQATELTRRLLGRHPQLAECLAHEATALYYLGRHEAALERSNERIGVLGEFFDGDDVRLSSAMTHSANCLRHLGRVDEAAELYARVVATHRRLGRRYFLAGALINLGYALHAQGDLDATAAASRESVEILRGYGDGDATLQQLGAASALLGRVELQRGRAAAAEAPLREALEIYRRGGASASAVEAGWLLGRCRARQGRYALAERDLQAALHGLAAAPGDAVGDGQRVGICRTLAAVYARWGAATAAPARLAQSAAWHGAAARLARGSGDAAVGFEKAARNP